MKKQVVLLLVAVCLLAAYVSAAESSDDGGFLGFITKFFSNIFDEIMGRITSLIGGEKPVVCNSPYMRYGSGCCLDADGSGICDRDERTTTTKGEVTTSTTEATTTTKATTSTTRTTTTTTTTTTSTTTTLAIICNESADCGEQKELRVCHNGDVFLKRLSPSCKKPGTPESYCSTSESWVGGGMMSKPVPTEVCGYGCKDGECL